MTSGERVRKIREESGLTLREFGERLRVSNVAISLVENNKNNLSARLAGEISREFKVSEAWLKGDIGGDEIIYDDNPIDDASRFAQEHNLDIAETILMREYLKLGDNERSVFRKYLKELVESLNRVPTATDQPETTAADPDVSGTEAGEMTAANAEEKTVFSRPDDDSLLPFA